MEAERSEEVPGQPCEEFEPSLILMAADELSRAEKAEVVDHLTHCSRCAAAWEREKDLLALLTTQRAEPDAALLASCRASLEDALDREEERSSWWRAIGAWLPASWLAPRPAWGAALFLLIGFSVGVLVPRLVRHPGASTTPSSLPSIATETIPNEPANAPLDLRSAEVAGISVLPSGSGQPPRVEVQLRAQRPFTVQGTVNNEDVKSVLLNVLRNNDRFDPGVRLDAVDLLRARNNDPDVRSALCHSVHTDRNAAVRLKALEALNGAEPQDIIRQTLLDALVDDQNPGVRIEAINALRQMAAQGQVVTDDRMLSVLRDRMQRDPSTYIRLQSAAAIRDLGPRQKF
jgi:hypothetical protein